MIQLIFNIILRVVCALTFIGFALGICLCEKHPIFEKIHVISATAMLTIGAVFMWTFVVTGK